MRRSLAEIETRALSVVRGRADPETARKAARHCAWLEAVGYPGLKLLAETRRDAEVTLDLVPDAIGLDLRNISCVFLAPSISAYVKANGRVFLRNVRHGLYLVPDSVEGNYAIGCPVDPAFPLGGERTKNPYAEKLETSALTGVEVDDALWQALQS